MKSSFLPGDLHLTEAEHGEYVVAIAGRDLFRSRSRRAALAKYNESQNGNGISIPRS